MSQETISLKALVDTRNKRVIFAESDEDFIDVLFSFLTMPMGTIIRLVRNEVAIGSMNNLYKSVEDIDEHQFRSNGCKKMLLYPRNVVGDHCKSLKLEIVKDELSKCYGCNSQKCTRYVFSHYENAICSCGAFMGRIKTWPSQHQYTPCSGVFVKGTARFIVTDELKINELKIEPASAIDSVSFLPTEAITDASIIKERDLKIGAELVLKLLKYSLTSKMPLTESFSEQLADSSEHEEDLEQVTEPISNREASNEQVSHANSRKTVLPSNVEEKVRIKLITSISKKMVCYAEASEDFVDLLFSFLTVPLGYIVKETQSRIPIGEETQSSIPRGDETQMQSSIPRAEETQSTIPGGEGIQTQSSIPRGEETQSSIPIAEETQSTIPRGEEIQTQSSIPRAEETQSTIPRGEEIQTQSSIPRAEETQSTIPRGEEIQTQSSIPRAEETQSNIPRGEEIQTQSSIPRAEETQNSIPSVTQNSIPSAEETQTTIPRGKETQTSIPRMEEMQNTIPRGKEMQTQSSNQRGEETQSSISRAEETQNTIPRGEETQTQSSIPRAEETENSIPSTKETQSTIPRGEEMQSNISREEEMQSSVPRAEETQSSIPRAEETQTQSNIPRTEEAQSTIPRAGEAQSTIRRAEETQSTIPRGEETQSTITKGCIHHLYNSICGPDISFLKSDKHKSMLVSPQIASEFRHAFGINSFESSTEEATSGVFTKCLAIFNKCKSSTKEATKGGFMKGPTLFTITDDLKIWPISRISGRSVMRNLGVADNDIEHHFVNVDKEKALRLLIASFVSESALTSTFFEEPDPES